MVESNKDKNGFSKFKIRKPMSDSFPASASILYKSYQSLRDSPPPALQPSTASLPSSKQPTRKETGRPQRFCLTLCATWVLFVEGLFIYLNLYRWGERLRSQSVQNKQHIPRQDRISLLPDEILISIVSLLALKEAVRTSVLSKRWTHLWNYVTLLDFDDCAALDKLSAQVSSPDHKRLLQRERAKFVKRVRKVLQSHKDLVLDEFRVDFDLDKSSQKAIDKWVRYAFQRKVLEFFLHNCKFLERLAVYHSRVLTDLEVSGPSLALQHLEICRCDCFKSLSVCDAANLVSLKISWTESIVLKNVPLLVGVSVCDFCGICNNTMKQFSYLLPKLEVLTLTLLLDQVERLYELPQLTELKQLTLIVDVELLEDDYSMLGLTSLIKASPNLEKFVLKLVWISRNVKRHIKLEKDVNYPLQHLKVVELCGYCGRTSELELVKCFVKNAISLEKIIIDPHRVSLFGARWDNRFRPRNRAIKQFEEDEEARRHARQHLVRLLPSHVGLTIV